MNQWLHIPSRFMRCTQSLALCPNLSHILHVFDAPLAPILVSCSRLDSFSLFVAFSLGASSFSLGASSSSLGASSSSLDALSSSLDASSPSLGVVADVVVADVVVADVAVAVCLNDVLDADGAVADVDVDDSAVADIAVAVCLNDVVVVVVAVGAVADGVVAVCFCVLVASSSCRSIFFMTSLSAARVDTVSCSFRRSLCSCFMSSSLAVAPTRDRSLIVAVSAETSCRSAFAVPASIAPCHRFRDLFIEVSKSCNFSWAQHDALVQFEVLSRLASRLMSRAVTNCLNRFRHGRARP